MTTKKKAQTRRRRKPLAEPTPSQGNVAQLLSGVLNDADTPASLVDAIHLGLDRLHEDVKDADRLTDTPEYLALLLAEHAAQIGGEQ